MERVFVLLLLFSTVFCKQVEDLEAVESRRDERVSRVRPDRSRVRPTTITPVNTNYASNPKPPVISLPALHGVDGMSRVLPQKIQLLNPVASGHLNQGPYAQSNPSALFFNPGSFPSLYQQQQHFFPPIQQYPSQPIFGAQRQRPPPPPQAPKRDSAERPNIKDRPAGGFGNPYPLRSYNSYQQNIPGFDQISNNQVRSLVGGIVNNLVAQGNKASSQARQPGGFVPPSFTPNFFTQPYTPTPQFGLKPFNSPLDAQIFQGNIPGGLGFASNPYSPIAFSHTRGLLNELENLPKAVVDDFNFKSPNSQQFINIDNSKTRHESLHHDLSVARLPQDVVHDLKSDVPDSKEKKPTVVATRDKDKKQTSIKLSIPQQSFNQRPTSQQQSGKQASYAPVQQPGKQASYAPVQQTVPQTYLLGHQQQLLHPQQQVYAQPEQQQQLLQQQEQQQQLLQQQLLQQEQQQQQLLHAQRQQLLHPQQQQQLLHPQQQLYSISGNIQPQPLLHPQQQLYLLPGGAQQQQLGLLHPQQQQQLLHPQQQLYSLPVNTNTKQTSSAAKKPSRLLTHPSLTKQKSRGSPKPLVRPRFKVRPSKSYSVSVTYPDDGVNIKY